MEERDPALEKNFIIFMILVMASIFGWMYLNGKKNPPAKPGSTPAKVSEQARGTTKPSPELTQPAPGTPASAPAPASPVPAGIIPAAEEKIMVVSSPLYRVTFSNQGAVPVGWELLKYQDQVYFPYEVSLKWPPFRRVEKFISHPVQLINPGLKGKPPLRTAIRINGISVGPDTLWQTDTESVSVEKGPTAVVFSLPLSGGGLLKKIYTFYPDLYRSELKIEYSGIEPDLQQSGVDFEMSYLFEPLNRLSSINFHGPIIHTGKKLVKFSLKDLNKNKIMAEPEADWGGFTDSYFLTALLAPPGSLMSAQAVYAGTDEALQDKKSVKEYGLELKFKPAPKLLSEHSLADLTLYFGPKQKDLLEQTRNTLGLAIDYGMWAPIAIPIMYCLVYLNKAIKNFGWSIIILTFLLRMAMFPLTRKGQKSMKELQKLQPEMEKIRKKFPDNKVKQQEEIYALQRKYKINPLGGCLPMLVQIPIFFAFYKVLLVSIELRHAPWMLWIPDLSSRDPLLILPVLMGGSQFLMQKLTPTAGDPMQARMMMFMPLIFTFMLIYFPSGLLLYWTVSNIIGIGQQVYVNKTMK